jgi:uncharacterized protein
MTGNNRGVRTLRIRPTSAAAAEPMDDPHYLPADPADLLHADPARRAPVSLTSAGARIAGHLYRPPDAPPDRRTAAIVMCGPFSSVKEQTLPHYAERFADAGYTVLTFDPRNFGESEGMPRYHHDPSHVIEDYANAVNHVLTREDVDPERVAVVGVCLGGGYAVSVGARDKRLKAVVSIGGGYRIGGTFQEFMGIEAFADFQRTLNGLVMQQYVSGEVQYIPTVSRGISPQTPLAAMPNEEAFSYYMRTQAADAPNWANRVTAGSLQQFMMYNSVVHAPLVAPTPLLIMHGTKDRVLMPEYAQQAYDAALGPKELIWIDTHNHIEIYDQNPYVSEAAAQTIAWLGRYVAP